MPASMPLPSMSESKHSVYFRCLLAIAVLIWPVAVVGQSSVNDNVVVQWDAAALQGVRDSRIRPPMVARALAIAHTCIFDQDVLAVHLLKVCAIFRSIDSAYCAVLEQF